MFGYVIIRFWVRKMRFTTFYVKKAWEVIEGRFIALVMKIANGQNLNKNREEVLCYKLNGQEFEECSEEMGSIEKNEKWITKKSFLNEINRLGIDNSGKVKVDYIKKVMYMKYWQF